MPLNPVFGESVDIVEWVWGGKKKKNLQEALDSDIFGQCKYVEEEMLLVLKIAHTPKGQAINERHYNNACRGKAKKKSISHNWGFTANERG